MAPQLPIPDRRGWKAALLAALAMASWLALAAPGTAPEAAGRVPMPSIERGQGDKCVEDTAFMRRNHMALLKHQRDATVRNGIRTRQHSLNGCIECHASRQNGAVIGTDQNFCQGCHRYAAVELDCFECHASKLQSRVPAPGAGAQQAGGAVAAAVPPAGGSAAGGLPGRGQ